MCTWSFAACSASSRRSHEGRLDICPAFPSDWREASIRTPDVSYKYRREGNRATMTHPHAAAVGQARAGQPDRAGSRHAGGAGVGRHAAAWARRRPPPEPAKSRRSWSMRGRIRRRSRPSAKVAREQQVLFDLSAACNVTVGGVHRHAVSPSTMPTARSRWRAGGAIRR